MCEQLKQLWAQAWLEYKVEMRALWTEYKHEMSALWADFLAGK